MNIETLKQFELKADPEVYKFTNLKIALASLNPETQVQEASVDEKLFYNLTFNKGFDLAALNIPGLKIEEVHETKHFFDNPFSPISQKSQSIYKITVLKNTQIDKPLRIVNLQNELSVLKLQFHLGPNSQLAVMEDNTCNTHQHVSITEIEFNLESGAKLEHMQIDSAYISGLHHSHSRATVEKDASYKNFTIHLGGHMIRKNQVCELTGAGANGELYSLYLINRTEHSDLNTIIHHKAADTTSQQLSKGILSGESKGIFTGRIHIHPLAQRVSSAQLNKNLLLSKKAQAHSQPQLEIFADDVKCSHGSTTGQLSPEEIFYFQARGIPENKAKTLLALGFGMEVVLKIHDSSLRTSAEKLVLASLKNKFHLGGAHD